MSDDEIMRVLAVVSRNQIEFAGRLVVLRANDLELLVDPEEDLVIVAGDVEGTLCNKGEGVRRRWGNSKILSELTFVGAA